MDEKHNRRVGGAAKTRRGFCIFINTLCQGRVPSVYECDGGADLVVGDRICVFETEREAQLEIADLMVTRLQQFMDGERDFDDATTNEEYILEVDVLQDGSVVDANGNHFRTPGG